MRFSYSVPRFSLEIVPNHDGRWLLLVNGDALGSYFSPEDAADDAAGQHTGHHGYDSSPMAAPEDLADWRC